MIDYEYTLEGFKTTSDSKKIGNLNLSTAKSSSDKSLKARQTTKIDTSSNKKNTSSNKK